MFRKTVKEDVTDEEWNNYIVKELNDQEFFLKDELIPEFIAFSISNGYTKGYTEYNDYSIHIKTCLTYFNLQVDEDDIKKKVTKVLKEKYNLIVVSEKPLDFKR